MDIWDLLFLTWLFKDDLSGNKTKKPKKVGIISLIFGLVGYYIIILGLIALILWLIGVKLGNVIFWVYTVIYGLFGLLLVISHIISKFKK